MLALTTLTGCQGVNGGGWAHYVGQEKVPPVHRLGAARLRRSTGCARRGRWPARRSGTSPPTSGATTGSTPTSSPRRSGAGASPAAALADCLVQSARMGWMPSYPDVRPQPARPRATRRRRPARTRCSATVRQLVAGQLRFAARTRTTRRTSRACSRSGGRTCWAPPARATSTSCATCSAPTPPCGRSETPETRRPADVTWRDEAPEGKLDLLVSLDFRMTSTTLFSRRRCCPAATWYEKYDLSSTDMHPFVHAFNAGDRPAVGDAHRLRRVRARIAAGVHRAGRAAPGRPPRPGRHAAAARHAGRDRASPAAGCWTGAQGECEPGPGPDDAQASWSSSATTAPWPSHDDGARPAGRGAGHHRQGRHRQARPRRSSSSSASAARCGAAIADGRPARPGPSRPRETILALSGTTNGRLAVAGFRVLEQRTGDAAGRPRRGPARAPHHLRGHPVAARSRSSPAPSGRAASTAAAATPRSPSTSSGSSRGTPSPAAMHFFLDHDWMVELGEQLPIYRPPLDMARHLRRPQGRGGRRPEVTVRYLTPALQVVDPLGVPGQPVHAHA